LILELDDFDFWVDEAVSDGIYKFSPVFVFIIGWGIEEGLLEPVFLESRSIKKKYEELLKEQISFRSFVEEVLRDRIEENMFKSHIREFVVDYIECDGYSFKLSEFFNCSLWDIPHDLSKSKEIFSMINNSRKNYEKHKAINPKLAIFEDYFEHE